MNDKNKCLSNYFPIAAVVGGVLSFSISMLTSQAVFAHGGIDKTEEGRLVAMVKQAPLVFLGRVEKVDYRLARLNKKGRIPVTYVTYGIEKVVRGKTKEKNIVMRFMGGTDGMGHFLSISNVPRFQKNDRDILFVSSNGEKSCPLVNCQDGRFRILDGGVYNAHGVPVRALTEEGVISRGHMRKEFAEFRYPAPRFDDLVKNPEVKSAIDKMKMNMAEAKRRYEKEAPKEIVEKSVVVLKSKQIDEEAKANADGKAIVAREAPLQEGPIAMEMFMDHVAGISKKVGGRLPIIESVDARTVAAINVSGPVAPALESGQFKFKDDRRLMIEGDGNPVIRQ